MNDELLMNKYLLILKSTVEVYVHGTLESSNESSRNTLKHSLDEIMSMQANLYDKMVEYGWYQVNNIESSEISKTLEKLNSSN